MNITVAACYRVPVCQLIRWAASTLTLLLDDVSATPEQIFKHFLGDFSAMNVNYSGQHVSHLNPHKPLHAFIRSYESVFMFCNILTSTALFLV